VIFEEEDDDGRERVTEEEERVFKRRGLFPLSGQPSDADSRQLFLLNWSRKRLMTAIPLLDFGSLEG